MHGLLILTIWWGNLLGDANFMDSQRNPSELIFSFKFPDSNVPSTRAQYGIDDDDVIDIGSQLHTVRSIS